MQDREGFRKSKSRSSHDTKANIASELGMVSGNTVDIGGHAASSSNTTKSSRNFKRNSKNTVKHHILSESSNVGLNPTAKEFLPKSDFEMSHITSNSGTKIDNLKNNVTENHSKDVTENRKIIRLSKEASKYSAKEKRPSVITTKSDSLVDDSENLRQKELKALEIRYKSTFKMESSHEFSLTISPSDPDFPFDIGGLSLRISQPDDYPRSACTVFLLNTNIPEDISRNVTTQIQHRMNSFINAFLLREVFNWVDKNMEAMILKKPAPVLQFIRFEKSSNNVPTATTTDSVASNKILSEKSMGSISDLVSSESLSSTKLDNLPTNVTEGDDLNVYIPAPEPTSDSSSDDANDEIETSKKLLDISESATITQVKQLSLKDSSSKASFAVAEHRGTQIILDSMMIENLAVVVCTLLKLQLRCLRCQTVNDMNCMPHLDSPWSCSQCKTLMTVRFRPSLLHMNNQVLGYLDLNNCSPFDLLPSHYLLTCMNCNLEMRLKDCHFNSKMEKACHSCHMKYSMVLASYRFVKIMNYDRAKTNEIQIPLIKKKTKDPFTLKQGQPLPEYGTCKHYKKSYRWFRFPCCGKAFPCDICHEEKKGDSHEMVLANRIICGYCSKEQTVTNKVCPCGQHVTQISSRFWEGGEGCRNKKSMNRNDSHKYKNSESKTKSKKALRVGELGKEQRQKKQGDSVFDKK